MAYEMKIRGTESEVKVRSPWAVALLPIITLGIYHLVWWYKINKELKAYGEAKGYDLGQNPTNSLLALFPGGLIIIPALITYWRGTKRVQGASKVAGREPVNGWIALLLYLLLSPGMWAYLQVSLNHIWEQEADPLPGQEAPPAHGDAMPPRPPRRSRRPGSEKLQRSLRCVASSAARVLFSSPWRGARSRPCRLRRPQRRRRGRRRGRRGGRCRCS